MVVSIIEKVYSFLWGDWIKIPLPGGGSLGISLLIILLIPTGIYFTIRTKFLQIRLFPDMVRALVAKKEHKYTVLSAFVLFLIMPYVVYHLSLPWTQWWWKGMIVSAVLTLPLVITSGRGSSRCAFPLLLASVVVGAFISFLGHYLL